MEDPVTPKRNSIRTKAQLSRVKKIIIWIGAIIVLLGLGFEAFRVLTKKSITPVIKQVDVQLATPVKNVPKDVPDAGTNKAYSNDTLGLKFSYPDTWKVTDTADQGVRVESPEFSFVTNSSGNQDGMFRVYIRKGARPADSKYIGRGYAIGSSEKLTYSNPATNQRKDTLITQFGLDAPDNFAYFFIAGNFQLSKGDTLGPDYGKEASTFIISGGFSSSSLSDDMAAYPVAVELPATSNAYKQAIGIVTSLQLE